MNRILKGWEPLLPVDLAQFLLGFFIFSFLFSRSYLLPELNLTQAESGEELIQEEGLVETPFNSVFFTQPAFAYSEALLGDGSALNLVEKEPQLGSAEDFLMIVENDSFLSINSPLSFYLPTAKRHGLITYTVKEGDTAGKIAANFGVSLNTVLWANNLKSGSLLKPGQELVILPVSGVKHVVQKGDTLSSLAKKYQAVPAEILAFNNLPDEKSLKIGQELIIPNGQLPSNVSLASQAGLSPMTSDTSNLPNLKGYFAYPTSGGWNHGILHNYNAVDISNTCGSPIYASADGIVVEALNGWNGGYGNYVKIQHLNGTLTLYGHLGDLYVTSGKKVTQGQTLGTMSDTGKATGCHLHFEVRGAQNPFVLKK